MRRIAPIAALALAIAACASPPPGPPAHGGGKVEPKSDAERLVLERLDRLPSGQAITVGGVVVVAEPPYFAASGATCRSLVVSSAAGEKPPRRRLACKAGEAWFFAPDVLASPLP